MDLCVSSTTCWHQKVSGAFLFCSISSFFFYSTLIDGCVLYNMDEDFVFFNIFKMIFVHPQNIDIKPMVCFYFFFFQIKNESNRIDILNFDIFFFFIVIGASNTFLLARSTLGIQLPQFFDFCRQFDFDSVRAQTKYHTLIGHEQIK